MKKTFTFFTLAILVLASCVKPPEAIEDLKKSCLYDSEKDYFNKWANVFTVIETTDVSGSVSKETIFPIGYFQLSSDGTYSRMSNNVPLSGKWDVSDSCKLILDPDNVLKREFDVLNLTLDSLTLRRKVGNITYVQHYAAFNCFDESKLVQTWDNTIIEQETYDGENVYPSYSLHPIGNLVLNSDKTYTRLSDGDYLAGSWLVNNNCQLVLDKGTNLERAFDIQKLTADSLVIWRKDIMAHMNYLQKYVKH